MKTLRQAGLFKILKGLTTPEEVLRVTHQDIEET
jgi:type II secretory ATPase GspE/PulE/Tfp pilus assembly ATPase PilB-like protein